MLKIHEQDKKHVDELARERDILNKNFLKARVQRITITGDPVLSTFWFSTVLSTFIFCRLKRVDKIVK